MINTCPFGPHDYEHPHWQAMCEEHYRPYWVEYQDELFQKEITESGVLTRNPNN